MPDFQGNIFESYHRLSQRPSCRRSRDHRSWAATERGVGHFQRSLAFHSLGQPRPQVHSQRPLASSPPRNRQPLRSEAQHHPCRTTGLRHQRVFALKDKDTSEAASQGTSTTSRGGSPSKARRRRQTQFTLSSSAAEASTSSTVIDGDLSSLGCEGAGSTTMRFELARAGSYRTHALTLPSLGTARCQALLSLNPQQEARVLPSSPPTPSSLTPGRRRRHCAYALTPGLFVLHPRCCPNAGRLRSGRCFAPLPRRPRHDSSAD